MAFSFASSQVDPFESAAELRQEHHGLLDALDQDVGDATDVATGTAALEHLADRIRRFLERGAATGVYLEDIRERTACQVLLDYWAGSLSRAGMTTTPPRLAHFQRETLPDLKDKPCPYVGLDPFREGQFFFGRDEDTRKLLERLDAHPLLVVVGASGSGKSSLVLAGLLPALRTRSDKPLRIIPSFVPGAAVLDSLARALGAGPGEADRLRAEPARLSELLGGESAPPTCLTIDQFEEVFNLGSVRDREALDALLVGLLEAGRGHRLILTMREEFKSRMVELRRLAPFLAEAWHAIRPMSYEELRAAVDGPAAAVNLRIKPEISDDLVKKVLAERAALPLLQFTLKELWNQRDRNRITWEVYRRVRDPLHALPDFAESFYLSLSPEKQEETQRVLLALVQVTELLEPYRQPIPRHRLTEAGRADTDDVLKRLQEVEFIRIAGPRDDPSAIVEIKHEALIRNWPRLGDWIDDKRQQRRQRLALTQASARWCQADRPAEGLLTGWQLRAAEQWPDLTPLEREFVEASGAALERASEAQAAAQERELQQTRELAEARSAKARLLRQAVIGLALTSIFGIAMALVAAHKSERLERVVQAVGLAPLEHADDHMDLAFLLGIEASRIAPDRPEVRRALPSALTTNLEFHGLFAGHSEGVTALVYSRDGKVLASGSRDGVLILRNAITGTLLVAPIAAHAERIVGLAFSSDGHLLASVSAGRTARLWDVRTGGRVGPPLDLGANAVDVAIAPDGKRMAVACDDGTVQLWDLAAHQRLRSLPHAVAGEPARTREVSAVAFLPGEDFLLASGGKDGRVVFWDGRSEQPIGPPLRVAAPVTALAFAPDGKTLATGNSAGRTDLWDVEQRMFLRSMREDHVRAVRRLAFTPSGLLATIGEDRTLYLRNPGRLKGRPQKAQGYSEPLESLAASPTSEIVATGTRLGTVVLWDADKRYHLATTIRSSSGSPTAALFDSEGSALLSYEGGHVVRWTLSDGAIDSSSLCNGESPIKLLVSSPATKSLVVVRKDDSVESCELTTGDTRRIVPPGTGAVEAAAMSDDGQLALAIDRGDREVRLLHLPEGSAIGPPLPVPGEGPVDALAFTPDGSQLAVASSGEDLALWQLASRKRASLPRRAVSVAFSQVGGLLATGGADGEIQLWRLPASGPAIVLESHVGPVRTLQFSPDGTLLASGGWDSTVLLWDTKTGERLVPPMRAHPLMIDTVDFSPGGEALVSASSDGSIYVWRMGGRTQVWEACRIAGRNFTDGEWRRYFGKERPRLTCVQPLLDDADRAALEGTTQKARKLLLDARQRIQETDYRANELLCRTGALAGFASLVQDACDSAVKWAPASEQPLARDSRGVVRALLGDPPGAIQDFTESLKLLKRIPAPGADELELRARREGWIDALQRGQDPFDANMLYQLRAEPPPRRAGAPPPLPSASNSAGQGQAPRPDHGSAPARP